MVARRRAETSSTVQPLTVNTEQLEKLTRLLALLVVKSESQPEKIKILASAGFTNVEIAEMLGLTGNAVNVALHRLRAK